MLSKLFKATAGVGVSLGLLFVVLRDDTPAAMETVRVTAAKTLLKALPQYQLKLQQTNQKLVKYENAIVDQAKRLSRLRSMMSRLDTGIADCDSVIRLQREKLAGLRQRIAADQTVFTSSGQPMTNGELQHAIKTSSRLLQSAQRRSDALLALRKPCQEHVVRLQAGIDQAPSRVASVRAFCNDLRAKIELVREMKSWDDELRLVGAESTESPESLEQSLHHLSDEIDADLFALETSLKIKSGSSSNEIALSDAELTSQIDAVLAPPIEGFASSL